MGPLVRDVERAILSLYYGLVQAIFRTPQQGLSLQVRRTIGTYSAFGLGKGPFVAPWSHHNASTYKWGTPGHIEVLSGTVCTISYCHFR